MTMTITAMRLRHRKTLPDDFGAERRIDRYVHLDLNVGLPFGTILTPPPLYWSLVDPKFSLVEIPIDRRTGRLVGVTIPLYNGSLYSIEQNGESVSSREIRGVPVIDLEPWSPALQFGRDPYENAEDFYNVPGRCRIEVNADVLHVVLFPEPIRYRVLTQSSVLWEFNESEELCALRLLGLTEEERAALREGIEKQ
jgi:hypothetical protein